MKSRVASTVLVLALMACDEMEEQPRYDAYGEAELFDDGKVLQLAPAGTVARDDAETARALAERPEMSSDLLARGRDRFQIFCTPCHDTAGYGRGEITRRGFPNPPSLHTPALRQAPAAHFVSVITDGYGVMYSYADRIPPADRWAIAAYIRALQLSQNTTVADVPADERVRLEGQ